MAVDITRQGTKGGDSGYDTSQLRGVREEKGIITGVVKANVHPTSMGVIKIWNATFSTDENDKTQWRTVRYCTPFYSRVDNAGVDDTYFGTKVTAGIVTPPPDIGTKVLAFFPEGRNSEGYYFACVPDTYMMQTLPETTISAGVAAGEFNDSPAGSHHSGKITNWRTQTRPEDFFTQDTLVKQGLSDDRVRGLNNSGYMRESPAEIIGIATKGRRITTQGQDFTQTYATQIRNPNTADKKILEGLLGPTARRKGHSIALDDGDIEGNSNQIRLRTSTGHQLLLNDTEGVIYVGNSDGSCWIELSSEGTMDVFAQDSINFRSANINFHADENIKMHAKGFTQIVADRQLHLQGTQETTIVTDGEAGINAKKNLHLFSESELFATSTGASYYNAGGNISVAGAMVLLQGPKTQAKQAKKVSETQKEDTTYFPDLDQFILDEEEMVTTTVDRVVTHEPFPYHSVMNTTSAYTGGLGGASGQTTSNYGIVPATVTQPTAVTSPEAVTGSASPAATTTGASGNAGFAAIASAAGISEAQLQSQIGAAQSQLAAATSASGATSLTSGNAGFAQIASAAGISEAQLQSQIGAAQSQLQGADFNKLIKDSSGKITGLADQLSANAPQLTAGLQSAIPNVQDQLGSVLSTPNFNKFPVTDLVAQANTGFSVGALDSFDVQGLNAAVVKQVGSANNPAFIDSVTKSVGKFGFNVDQLKSQGFVRPEAVFNDQLSDSSVWTGKAGASSLNKMLSNSPLQESIQQGVVAADYQKLVNLGGIKATDGKKEVMSMLTASNISTPEITAQVRQGFQNIENVLPNTTNIPGGEDIASKVKQSMQTGAAASERVEKIKVTKNETVISTSKSVTTGGESTTTTTPVTGGQVTTGTAYTPSDDLLDSTAEADAQEQANIDDFNAEATGGQTKTSDDDPYGFDAAQKQAEEREESQASKRKREAEAELERKKKQGGYAAYKAFRDQARELRKQWWANRRKLSKADKAALESQIKGLLAQADAALNNRGSGDG